MIFRHTAALLFLLLSISPFAVGELRSERRSVHAPDALSEQQRHTLQAFLEQFRKDSGLPGVVAMVWWQGRQWQGAAGWADLTHKRPMQPDDALRIASVSKLLVATTVLRLVEEGVWGLDQPLFPLLPDVWQPSLANARHLTLRHLLGMSSGIPDYLDTDTYNDSLDRDPQRTRSREELLSHILGKQADYRVGEGWSYSNSNYVLLDFLVERMTGSPLHAQMRRLIFTPLAMSGTFTEIHEKRSGGFGGLQVRGYNDNGDVTAINDALGVGDGGLISDAGGLVRFMTALLHERRLLTPAMLQQMMTIHPESPEQGQAYGLGLGRFETPFGTAWGHDGSSAGFQSDLTYLPDQEMVVAILVNHEDRDVITDLFEGIVERLVGDAF
ncbi:MAG: beta-lactamase family protein [Magnetococcales bacterium]|nr:beta-lactamase family protein [Magnetococcales bacterium]